MLEEKSPVPVTASAFVPVQVIHDEPATAAGAIELLVAGQRIVAPGARTVDNRTLRKLVQPIFQNPFRSSRGIRGLLFGRRRELDEGDLLFGGHRLDAGDLFTHSASSQELSNMMTEPHRYLRR